MKSYLLRLDENQIQVVYDSLHLYKEVSGIHCDFHRVRFLNQVLDMIHLIRKVNNQRPKYVEKLIFDEV